MKPTLQRLTVAVAIFGVITAGTGVLAAPVKHPVKHKAVVRHRAQYVIRRSAPDTIVNTRPLAHPIKVPATPIPQTPGASPATPPVVPGGSGDTRTPMTPPGVGGTGVPGGPGTLP